jgi:putative transposase
LSARRRRNTERVEPTHEWEQLVPMFEWPEQENYEVIRPLVLFGEPVAQRAEETGVSERTLYRRIEGFEHEGMDSLFGTEKARRKRLPPATRRLIVDLKAEYPAFNTNEIANIVYVVFGRRPDVRTVRKVLDEEAWPLKLARDYPRYQEIEKPKERRMAIVKLHAQGWSVKAIAGYLKITRDTVYRALKRFIEEGEAGLEDKTRGRPKGVGKVDLKAIDAVRRLQKNPNLGEFRVHAALAQIGIHLSPRTCGRILALNRRLYGYEKPKSGDTEKKLMPFASKRRHEFWTTDVRYIDEVDEGRFGGKVYVISMLENHSRALLASALTRTQDTTAFLSVLYEAVKRYGSPEALVTDGGGIFRSNRANAVYEALNICKEEFERGKPWQSYIETTFNVQRRMADHHFATAESWQELVEAHAKWVRDYNEQSHWAHRERTDGRRSPQEVLGWLTGVRYREEDLERAFFSSRFSRKLDWLGYATFRRWKLYGEEALAGSEAALWLEPETLTVEYAGEPLSRYEVHYPPGSTELHRVGRATLFETPIVVHQPRLFDLAEALGEEGWLKALRLADYAPRMPRRPELLQEVLFPYTEAI